MRKWRNGGLSLLAVLFAFVAMTALAGAAAEKRIMIAEAMQRPNYRAAYETMLADQKNVPKWMQTSDGIANAVSAPSMRRIIDGQENEIFEMCPAGACDSSGLILMFSRQGDVAQGVLVTDDEDDVFFGNPTIAETKALLDLKD